MPGHNFLHIRQKWSLYCAVFASAVQIQSVLAGTTIHEAHQIVCCNALYCDCDMWSELKVIRELKYFFFKACSASTWNTPGIHLTAVLCPGMHC